MCKADQWYSMNEFTPGQKARMHDAFDLYRRP